MGQHLILYASNALTLAEVEKWCHARAHELIEVPNADDQRIVSKVQGEMDQLRPTEDHLEHWSNWCGVLIWRFLIWHPRLCDATLINRAEKEATIAMQSNPQLRSRYPDKDFTTDTPIEFLRSHLGYVVWGDNDGI